MSKLDDLLAALSDDSPWSMKAAEVLSIPNSEIRDLLFEYVQRHERAQWFGPHQYPSGARFARIMIETVDSEAPIFAIGCFTASHNWMGLYKDGTWYPINDAVGRTLLRWRYLPEYPEGGE